MRIAKIFFQVVLCLLTLVCTNAVALESVKVQLKWQHQFQFAGYYMAKELGFYERSGLDVSFIEAKPGLNYIDEVLEGRADFGVATSELILRRAQGEPVVVLGVIFQHSPQVIAVLVDDTQAITNLHDMAQHPIMLEEGASELWALFQREGISRSKLNVVEHSFDIQSLISGEVKGMSVYLTDEPASLRKAGIPFKLIEPLSSGIDFYGDNFFTTEGYLSDNPEQVDAFIKATKAGWNYAYTHIDETIDHILTRYSKRVSREKLEFEAQGMIKLNQPALVEPGYMNKGRWQHIADTYSDLGLMKRQPNLNDFMYRKKSIDWSNVYRFIGIVLFASLVLGSALAYVILLNKRLREEASKREKVEQDLIASSAELKLAYEEQSSLINMFSHEYRTPLSVIKNTTALLEQEVVASLPKTQGRFDMLWRAVNRLVLLVDDALSPDRTKGVHTASRDNGPSDILKVLTESAQALSVFNQGEIELLGISEGKIYVMLAEKDLKTCLDNVVSNALKYSHGKNIVINVQLDDSFACIDVTDYGIGIPEADIDNVSHKYQRASNTGTVAGAGLGLYMVKQIIESIGGNMTIDSELGVGTTMSLFFPLVSERCTEH